MLFQRLTIIRKKTGKRLCIVVGANADIPEDKDSRLRRGNKNEQDILICSNLLSAFYRSEKNQEKGTKRYRFEFAMREEVKKIYQQCTEKNQGLYLPGVNIIRDGESRGFPFVEPWMVDVLLVLGGRFDMCAVSNGAFYNNTF